MSINLASELLIQVVNDIGLMIKQQFFQNNPNESEITLSPTSILLCSLLAYPGMNANTKHQFEETFFKNIGKSESIFSDNNQQSNDLLLEAINYFKSILNFKDDKNSLEIKLSNSIYLDNKFDPLEKIINYFQKLGDLNRINLEDNDNASNVINQQISNDTNGNIKDIIKPDMLINTIMVLVNALYFEAKWKYGFYQGSLSNSLNFKKSNGQMIELYKLIYVPKVRDQKFSCYEDDQVKVVSIPYKNENYAMLILVPNENTKINLSSVQLGNYLNKLGQQYCEIIIPKWIQRSNIQLKEILSELGMSDMFNGSADFTNIHPTQRMHVSNMIHEALVEVDKDGTKAAAVTVMTIVKECVSYPPKPTFYITADRTFAYSIYHIPSGLPLFEGIYDGSIDNKIRMETATENKILDQQTLEKEAKADPMYKCFGNKKIYYSSENLWYEIKNEGAESTNVYCMFCKQNKCTNEKYSMLNDQYKIVKKFKIDKYYVDYIHCSCKKCCNISDEEKLKKEKEILQKNILEYKQKCVGKLHKKPATYIDNDGFTRYQHWFGEKGIPVEHCTYCLYCAQTKCNGLQNKQLVKIPSNIVANFPNVNCDCPHCNNN